MNMRLSALNSGPDYHLLDHIAPLATLMEMPLLVAEERNFELAQRYYPFLAIHFTPDLEFQLPSLAEQFDALFECKYWAPHLPALFRDLHGKEMRLVFCPHGQSDKGFSAPLLAPYAQQDTVLLYGDLHKEMLCKLNIPVSKFALTGNYRLSYYLQHREFYDALAEKEIFSRLDLRKPILLYAPTWKDADQATSLFSLGPNILSQLPSNWNLLIKIHPLLEEREPVSYYAFASLVDRTPNALLVSEFPPVYPLLSRAAAYLGDYSSVGYDFLAFERPMFFFAHSHLPPMLLHSCGTLIDPSHKNLFSLIERSASFAGKQRALYAYAFGKRRTPQEIKRELLCSFSTERRQNKNSLEII